MNKLVWIILLLNLSLSGQNSLERYKELSGKAQTFLYKNADSSLFYADRCLKIGNALNVDSLKFSAYMSLGNAYTKLLRLGEATEAYFNALRIADKGRCDYKAKILGNIGYLYNQQHKFKEAHKYIKESYIESLKCNDVKTQVTSLNNFNNFFNMNGMPDSSLVYLYKAVEVCKKNNLRKQEGLTYDNIANTYYSLAEAKADKSIFKKTLQYADSALVIHEALHDSSGIVYIKGLLGATYMALSEFDKSEKYYKEFEILSANIGDVSNLLVCYDEASHLFKLQKKFEKAYEMRLKYDSLYKKHFNEASNKQIEELKTVYQTEKKDKEFQLLEAKSKLSDETIKRQKVTVAAIIIGSTGLLVLLILIFINLKNQKKINRIISEQKNEVESQKEIIEEKNKEILDSITYAKRIQDAILPPQKLVKQYLNNSFVLYKPKDIVAGDFYWMEHTADVVLFAAADCTGHGVPGALVSVVCSNALNRCVKEFGLIEPGKILDKVRTLVIETFEKSDEEVMDGMDISLCVLNLKNNELMWAGANNPLWLIRNKELIEIKADKQPIGKYTSQFPFTTHHLKLESNDCFYIFSDGYADQFGGPNGKKFKTASIKKLLISVNNLDMLDQRNAINKTFEEWRGNLEQLDDVCIIGVRV